MAPGTREPEMPQSQRLQTGAHLEPFSISGSPAGLCDSQGCPLAIRSLAARRAGVRLTPPPRAAASQLGSVGMCVRHVCVCNWCECVMACM